MICLMCVVIVRHRCCCLWTILLATDLVTKSSYLAHICKEQIYERNTFSSSFTLANTQTLLHSCRHTHTQKDGHKHMLSQLVWYRNLFAKCQISSGPLGPIFKCRISCGQYYTTEWKFTCMCVQLSSTSSGPGFIV